MAQQLRLLRIQSEVGAALHVQEDRAIGSEAGVDVQREKIVRQASRSKENVVALDFGADVAIDFQADVRAPGFLGDFSELNDHGELLANRDVTSGRGAWGAGILLRGCRDCNATECTASMQAGRESS